MPTKTLKHYHDRFVRSIKRRPGAKKLAHAVHTAAEEQIATEADVRAAFVDAVMAHCEPSRSTCTFLNKFDPRVGIRDGRWTRKR